MGLVTIILGAFLAVLGVVGYVATGSEHPTALIATGFGVVFIILGVLARQDKLRRHVMHAAAMLGLVGFLVPAIRGVPNLVRMIAGHEVPLPNAAVLQSLMALACLVFVGLCIRSFIEARRARRAREAAESRAG